MDWLSVDYCAEIRNFIIDYVAQERRRVQTEITAGPERIAQKIRSNGENMQRVVNALSARIDTLA